MGENREDFILVLEDGKEFSGLAFGAFPQGWAAGEVVFNTSSTGYQEILTDPSYAGQLVVFTSTHIGNYGCKPEWNENPCSTATAHGAVCRNLYEGPLQTGRIPFDAYLKELGIGGLSGIDTRSLTLHLREEGSLKGVLLPKRERGRAGAILESLPSMEGRALARETGSKRRLELRGSTGSLGEVTLGEVKHEKRIGLIDFGVKGGILRELTRCGAAVTLFPSSIDSREILSADLDGVLLSNGPGDPAVLDREIGLVSDLLEKVPLFGICLGHQLLALALGGKTGKMRFGHHGANHPVRELKSGRVFVTSQNHGFEVLPDSLPGGTELTFINTNDGTVEGISSGKARAWSVQFHPEAAPGPREASRLFDRWMGELG